MFFHWNSLYYAGGVPAIMEEIKEHLHLDVMTVTGKTLGENLVELKANGYYEGCENWLHDFNEQYGVSLTREDIIRPYDSGEECLDAVFIRYEGPKGSGMPEMFYTSEAISSDKELGRSMALITDGRFLGASTGPVIGHYRCKRRKKGFGRNGYDSCGKKMTELVPGTSDGAHEKHVPVVTIDGDKVTVEVGSVEHPMVKEHYIQWIEIETTRGSQRVKLEYTDKPRAEFRLADGEKIVSAYEYCNIHGLWKK